MRMLQVRQNLCSHQHQVHRIRTLSFQSSIPIPDPKLVWTSGFKIVRKDVLAFEECMGRCSYIRPNLWSKILPPRIYFFIFNFVRIGFIQLVPNSYIHLIYFIAFYQECRVEPSIDLFFAIFTSVRSKKSGYRQLNKQLGWRIWMKKKGLWQKRKNHC